MRAATTKGTLPWPFWAISRVAIVLVVVVACLSAALQPAFAALPANDQLANARALTGVPTRIVQDTSQATYNSTTDNNPGCVYGASVWYRIRLPQTTTVRFSTIGTQYTSVLSIFRGPRDARTVIACSDPFSSTPQGAQVRLAANATYWIAVSACCDSFAPGGRTVLSVYRPQPLTVTRTISSIETGGVSGRLFVSGTYRCSTPA